MTSRRRRRDRRARPDHPEPPKRIATKSEQRRTTEHRARLARIARTRTVVGMLGFVPLAVSFACASIDLGPLCAVPREVYLGVWAAIFGSFLGLTIRMWRERRAFERASAS